MNLYRAIIEDNNSPLKDGRVKVRIIGIHTPNNENSDEKFNYVSTDDLPWAEVMQSMAFGFGSGLGVSSIPTNGTWVFVAIGEDSNKPIVMGAIAGTSTKSSEGTYDSGAGFCDPNGIYPLSDRLEEPDINRLSRVQKLTETVHQTITDNIIADEPASTNDSSLYPDNSVIETKSGHVIEIDDTETNERIRVFHKSGSYCEFKPDGTVVIHTEGSNYEMVKTDKITNIGANRTTDIGGDETLSVTGLLTIDASGTLILTGDVKIDGSLEVTGDLGVGGDSVSSGEISDGVGTLSSLRDAYGQHMHIGNQGSPTPLMIPYVPVPAAPYKL